MEDAFSFGGYAETMLAGSTALVAIPEELATKDAALPGSRRSTR